MGWRSPHTHGARASRSRGLAVAAVFTLLSAGVAACGGGERRDADEPEGDFPVEVTEARFPARQRLAQTSDLRLAIENVGDEPLPDLAITIYTGDEKADGSFSIRSEQPGLADPNRPVWILENGYPKLLTPALDSGDLADQPTAGAQTAQTNTFSFGPVQSGDTVDAVWRVTPVQPGTYTVHYEISAGLYGKAKAVTGDGSPAEGEFVATITDRPPQARVNDAGQVEIGKKADASNN